MIIIANARYWLDCLDKVSEGHNLSEMELRGAARALDAAAATSDAWDFVLPLASALHPYMQQRGYWTEWDTFLQYLCYHAQRQADQAALINFLIKLGHIKRQRSDYDAAIQSYRRAWKLCRGTNHRSAEAVALSNLGDLYRTQKCFWRAETLCKQALALFTSLKDPLRKAYTENNLALIYLDQRSLEDARAHFDNAIELFTAIEYLNGLALVWRNLSILYIYRGDTQKALGYLQKAMSHYEQHENEIQVARVCINMATVYLDSNDLAQAEQVSLRAEAILERMDDTLNLARARHNLGMVYTRTHQHQEAERCFSWALEQWRKRQEIWSLANTLGELVDLYLDQGRWFQARSCLEEVAQLIDGVEDMAYETLQRDLLQRQQRLAGFDPTSEDGL